MTRTLEQITAEELQALVNFSRTIVVKEQEVADAAEGAALALAGAGFVPIDRPPRAWEQVTVYVAPGSAEPELKRGPLWVYRPPRSPALEVAVSPDRALWDRLGSGSWRNSATGELIMTPPSTWVRLNVPAGETFIDPVGARVLIPTALWLDRTTGETSLTGPGSGDEFTGSTPTTPSRPPGLSDLIPTPQEYVSTRILLATGGLPASERAALEAAVASFSEYGLWEDRRQPLYATDTAGRLIFDAEGQPTRNPLRIVNVPFRGELNEYYRRLVRDHGVDPFVSRTAEQFEIVDWKTVSGLELATARRYVAKHAECVRVFKRAFYNEALEGDPLYFRFCRMFIAWMTVMEMVNSRIGGVGDVDRMNSYELTNLLYSFGIYQFDDLPLTYRRRFAKNLEKLLASKGTTEVFRDILAIFGLGRDVKIWKHFLVRFFPRRSTFLRFPRALAPGETAQVRLSDGCVVVATLENLAEELMATGAFRRIALRADGTGVELWKKK